MKDLSHLAVGDAPVRPPQFAHLLVDKLQQVRLEEGELPMAVDGARFRHSWAGSCSRLFHYRTTGVEETNPPDLPAVMSFYIGTTLHQAWQEALHETWLAGAIEGCDIEAVCSLPDIHSGGHIDAVVDTKDKRQAIEVKSINGFGFKMAVGERGPAQGPRHSALLQGALNAKAVDADELVIVYLSLEAISKMKTGLGEYDRIVAEWHYPREQYLPLADLEMNRIERLLRGIDDGKVPKRRIPDPDIPPGSIITDPVTGRWEQRTELGDMLQFGSTWHCKYCPMQDRCIADYKEGV